MPVALHLPPLDSLFFWDEITLARDPVENMALDEALLTLAENKAQPIFRMYRWDRPTLSFGYFTPYAQALAARRQGESMIRRWTGGGLVHHDEAWTWSLLVPQSQAFFRLRPVDSYIRLHGALAKALTTASFPEIYLVESEQPAAVGGLCAEAPVLGDVLCGGVKIAGSGQRRTRKGLLHQGILFRPEAAFPANFPYLLAMALAKEVTKMSPQLGVVYDLAKYRNPQWNQRI